MVPELEEELEVLRAIYGDDNISLKDAPDGALLRLLVDLQPRVERGTALVSVCLLVDLPVGYPLDAAPDIRVERSRGLSDADTTKLLSVANAAIEEFGHQDMGCVSQVLSEVSEALDVANDTSECSICLLPCPAGGGVHAACDHIFCQTCLGRWAAMKDEEAALNAGESMKSVQAERDALVKDVSESHARHIEASDHIEAAQTRLNLATRLVNAMRARINGEEYEDAAGNPLDYWEEEEEPNLERLSAQLRSAKDDMKTLQAKERKAQARVQEVTRRMEDLDAVLGKEAAERMSAGLPCPVCRKVISRDLVKGAIAAHKGSNVVVPKKESGSVSALPKDLREQAYRVQKEQQRILDQRVGKAGELRTVEQAPATSSRALSPAQGDSVGDRTVGGGRSNASKSDVETTTAANNGSAASTRRTANAKEDNSSSWRSSQSWDDQSWQNGDWGSTAWTAGAWESHGWQQNDRRGGDWQDSNDRGKGSNVSHASKGGAGRKRWGN